MSLAYLHLKQLCIEIDSLVAGAVVQKITSYGARAFVISFLQKEKERHVLFCFQEPFLRIHVCKTVAEGISSNFVKKLSKELVGTSLKEISLLNEDRIACLIFNRKGVLLKLIAQLLPRRANCLLLESDQILTSLDPVETSIYVLPTKPIHTKHSQEMLNFSGSKEVEEQYHLLELQDVFEKRKRQALSIVNKAVKRAQKNVEDRKQTLQKCENWKQVEHQGKLLQANLYRIKKGVQEINISDWEQEGKEVLLILNPLLEPSEIVSEYFKKSKKLRVGIPHAVRQLDLIEKEYGVKEKQLAELSKVENAQQLDLLINEYKLVIGDRPQKSKSKQGEPAKPYYQYISGSGVTIWVGKSARDNDKLTFQFANGSDWWLHARDYPGSHVVIHGIKGEVDPITLGDAAELALRYSKLKDSGDVCLTQVKWLKRVKGIQGKVMLSKHRVLNTAIDEARWQRLKNSKF